MLLGKTIAVVVSAYNEETQIRDVLESLPEFVDRIVVVNDHSTDRTAEVVAEVIKDLIKGGDGAPLSTRISALKKNRYNAAEFMKFAIYAEEAKQLVPHEIVNKTPETDRVILINHLVNGGKGGAVATGYHWCREYGIDCTVTIDGDGQMDPFEMEKICRPVVDLNIDFVKGNRLAHRAASTAIPFIRYFGNSVLSILTKMASGYWTVSDTQTGYTAISLRALDTLKLHKLYRRYGVPNDILVKLNIASCSIREVEIKPVYGVGEQSKMKIGKVAPRISLLLLKSFFIRLWTKYFLKSFHPLFLLYHLAFFLILVAVPGLIDVIYYVFIRGGKLPVGNYIAFVFVAILAFQSLFFAMWMDIQDNSNLVK